MPGHFFQYRTRFSTGSRRGFTLAEMLVVMGVIAILLVVTLPAFKGLNQGNSRRGAVSALMGTLDRARMMAVSDGLPTYVVFARKTTSGDQVNTNLWGRAYAIFQDADNVNFNRVQRTPWTYLPDGVAFKVSTSTTENGLGTKSITTNSTFRSNFDPDFLIGANALSKGVTDKSTPKSAQLPYWKFDTTGAVDDKYLPVDPDASDSQGNYLRLLLFSGYVDEQGKEISTQNNGGRGNQTAALLEEIDLNPVTGRARYVVDPINNLAPTPTPST